MADAPLRITEAARQLGMPTKDLLSLVHQRKISHVMVNGIAHIPADVIDQYQATTS